MPAPGTIRVSLDVSPELFSTLENLSGKTHASKADVLRRAIALMQVAVEAKEQGKKVGVADKDQPLSTEFIGII